MMTTKRQKLEAINKTLRLWSAGEEKGSGRNPPAGCPLCAIAGEGCVDCPVLLISDDCLPWVASDFCGGIDTGPIIIALCLMRAMLEDNNQ